MAFQRLAINVRRSITLLFPWFTGFIVAYSSAAYIGRFIGFHFQIGQVLLAPQLIVLTVPFDAIAALIVSAACGLIPAVSRWLESVFKRWWVLIAAVIVVGAFCGGADQYARYGAPSL